MKINKQVQDLKRGDFICGIGHVQSINVFVDVQANMNSVRGQSKSKKLDRGGYARQVKFEQDVQYRPAQTGRVVITLVGGGTKVFDLHTMVEIWNTSPYVAKAA